LLLFSRLPFCAQLSPYETRPRPFDNAAMQPVRDSRTFDVLVTENMVDDILSDEAAMITGTIGTASSASVRRRPERTRLRPLRTDQRHRARHRGPRDRESRCLRESKRPRPAGIKMPPPLLA